MSRPRPDTAPVGPPPVYPITPPVPDVIAPPPVPTPDPIESTQE